MNRYKTTIEIFGITKSLTFPAESRAEAIKKSKLKLWSVAQITTEIVHEKKDFEMPEFMREVFGKFE